MLAEAKPIFDYITRKQIKSKIYRKHSWTRRPHQRQHAFFKKNTTFQSASTHLMNTIIEDCRKSKFPANVLLGGRQLSQIWQRNPQSSAYTRTHTRQHMSCRRKTRFYRRHIVCRRHRKNRFSRRLNERYAGFSEETCAVCPITCWFIPGMVKPQLLAKKKG